MKKEGRNKIKALAARVRNEGADSLNPSQLGQWVSKLSFSKDDFDIDLPLTPSKPYSRNLLYADETLEVIMMRWTPFYECAPHNHGDSFGVVQVLKGKFRHTIYSQENEQCIPTPKAIREETPKRLLSAPVGFLHSMESVGNHEQESYTLHFYTRPISKMKVYDCATLKVATVTDDCGAWWPEQKQTISVEDLKAPASHSELKLQKLKKEEDLARIIGIYNQSVIHSTATLDIGPSKEAQFINSFGELSSSHYITASLHGQVIGWGVVKPWSPKYGYQETVEVSLYIDRNYQGRGLGRHILDHLLEYCDQKRYHALLARVVDDNKASQSLFQAAGFQKSGTMHQVGKKFSQYWDVIIYQRLLSQKVRSTYEQAAL